jgi:hypothetical protein
MLADSGPDDRVAFAQLGGAVSRVPLDATAYTHRDAEFVLNVHGRWADPAKDAACIGWARDLFAAAAPFATGGAYVNFLTEEEGDRVGAAYGSNFRRLAEIKKKVDPTNFFRRNQNLQPAPVSRRAASDEQAGGRDRRRCRDRRGWVPARGSASATAHGVRARRLRVSGHAHAVHLVVSIRSALLHASAARLELVGRQVVLVSGDRPHVAEGIHDGATPVPVELVLDRALDLGAGRLRLLHPRIDILHVEQDRDRGAAVRLRAPAFHLGILVREHEDRGPDLDLGVADFPTRIGHPEELLGAEAPLVEVESAGVLR